MWKMIHYFDVMYLQNMIDFVIGYALKSGPKSWGGGNHQGKGSPCHSELLNYQR